MRASMMRSALPGSGRRALAAVLAAAVVGIVLVPPAAGAARALPAGAVSGADCPVEASDEATASEAAVRCGREVEVLDERTEWQTLLALPDGQLRLDTSASAQRTRVSGEWTDIDTSLVATSDGIAPVAPAVAMVFSDGTPGQPLARLQREGHELTFDVPFDVGEPVMSGSRLEYRDVLDGVDLIVTVDPDGTGFGEVLRVASAQAAADPRLAELAFPVEVSDDLVLAESNGGFVASDGSGEVVFTSPPPGMWDSRADRDAVSPGPQPRGARAMSADGTEPGQGVAADEVARLEAPVDGDRVSVMDVRVEGADDGDGEVVVTPDTQVLTDPGTVWPVYIDPSVKAGSRTEWASIRDDGWIDYNYTGDQGVGRCGTTGSPMYCSSVFTRRALWEFGDLSAIGDAAPADIVSATFRAYGTHSYSCTPAWVQAWQVGDVSGATRWPGPFSAVQEAVNVAHRPSCSNDRWIEFNVGAAARSLATAGGSTLGIGLRAADETTSDGWKRYRYDATLSVTYNLPPKAPTGVGFTNPAAPCVSGAGRPYVGTTTPTISGVFSDPAGQSVQANVALYALSAGIGRPRLNAGEQLVVGEQLTSPDGRTILVMQGDGNLVMYGPAGVNWHTGTNGKGGVRLVMQGDGNLVLYTAGNVPVWHIGANGLGGTHVELQGDGNLVVYTAAGGVVWQSGTPNVSPIMWTGRSALQASGAQHSVRVSGLLEGRPYRVQVNGVDADGRAGPVVSCELYVDTQAPGTPTVTSVTGTGLVAFPENQVGGNPNQRGQFRLGPGSSTDVVAYLYGIDTAVAGTRLEGSSPTLAYQPSAPGRHYLTVRSVDRAGNVSPTSRTYVFWVQNVPVSGRWTLDEGTGTAASDVRPGWQALSLSPSTTWGPGARAQIWLDDQADRALVFDGAGDVASSTQPVVATNLSYSVMAFVRLDDASVPRTAVSQDGLTASGFELGYRTAGCPSGMAGCWAFTVNAADGTSPAPVVLASTVPVQTGRWTQLTAVRGAAGSTSRLYVCDIGIGEDVSDGIPSVVTAAVPSLSWTAVGSLRLGQGRAGGAAANPWRGAISGVQVWEGPIDGDEVLRVQNSCRLAVIPELVAQP